MKHKQEVNVGALNFRQTIEGMPLVFNAAAAEDMKAIIQFDASGPEPGLYYMSIDSGKCSFHKGLAKQPTLTIHTPSDVWLKINSGELSGLDALIKGLYTVEGDANLLAKLEQLFKRPDNLVIEVKGQRPAGPLPMGGMFWMYFLLSTWTWLFLVIDFLPTDLGIAYAPPIIVALFIVIYRSIFNRTLWYEIVSLVFFVALAILNVFMQNVLFVNWGSTLALLVLGMIWLGSMIPPSKTAFTAEYSKWRYVPGLWTISTFIQPNMAICLCWGWLFVFTGTLAFIGKTVLWLFLPLLGVRLLLLVPAFTFTSLYQKGIPTRTFRDIDGNLRTLQVWACIGVALAVVVIVLILAGIKLPD